MKVKEVQTIEDAQIVRRIRNSVRQFMTRDKREISSAQQVEWWDTRNPSALRLFLYYDSFNDPVGFGMLTIDNEGRWWGTLAVTPESQNRGYGTEIYRHLISLVSVLYIEIFADNESSWRAAQNAGFKMEDVRDKVIVFSAKRKY